MIREPKITNEHLARMVKRGFDQMDERFGKIDGRLDILEQGQEDIKLRLDNVVHRFEFKDLVKRIERLELKVGLKRT